MTSLTTRRTMSAASQRDHKFFEGQPRLGEERPAARAEPLGRRHALVEQHSPALGIPMLHDDAGFPLEASGLVAGYVDKPIALHDVVDGAFDDHPAVADDSDMVSEPLEVRDRV